MFKKLSLLSVVCLFSANAMAGTCTWIGHPDSNKGNSCQNVGSAGDTVTITSISENNISLSLSLKNDDSSFVEMFSGTQNREMSSSKKNPGQPITVHGKYTGIDYLAYQVDDESQVLGDSKLLHSGKGQIILRTVPGDGGCDEAIFECK